MTSMPAQPSAREVAFHEAGHIFAGKRLGKTFISAEIHPDRLTGRASTLWAKEQSSTLVEGVTAAAGVCAEALAKGEEPPRTFPLTIYGAVSNDEEHARTSARAQEAHEAGARTEDEIVCSYLSFAETTCRADGHWAAIEEIALVLERDHHILNADVEAIFRQCGIPL